jgi:hypothetical protein
MRAVLPGLAAFGLSSQRKTTSSFTPSDLTRWKIDFQTGLAA